MTHPTANRRPSTLEVSATHDDGVVVLTMSDGRRNTLSAAAFATLHVALSTAMADSEVRAIVLCSAARAFSVVADLSTGPTALADLIAEDGGADPAWLEPAGRITHLIRSSPVPVIAAVDGDAIGGGATVCLGADLRIASTSARFAFPFGRVGIVPEGGSTWLLPRLVGLSRATDWLLSGRLVLAAEAHQAGLVSAVIEPAALLGTAVEAARSLGVATSPAARRRTLDLLDVGLAQPFDVSRRAESDAMRQVAGTAEVAEGITAFLERRPPVFPVTVGSARP